MPFKTATTNYNGSFKFDDIPPGLYNIGFAYRNNHSDIDLATGRAELSIVSGVDVTDITSRITALPSIGPNVVFEDNNGNGKFDAGTIRLPIVLVALYNSMISKVAKTFTDTNGMYSFFGLTPGRYYILLNKAENTNCSLAV